MVDYAILHSPQKARYELRLPKEVRGLTVHSNSALKPRATASSSSFDPHITRAIDPNEPLEGNIVPADGRSEMTLLKQLQEYLVKEYFDFDAFTIVDSKFTFQPPRRLLKDKDTHLLLRYNTENGEMKQLVLRNFTIDKKDLMIQGNTINDCSLLLRDRNTTIPVAVMTILFVEKKILFLEFDALLKTMQQKKNRDALDILYDYYYDVYGYIDGIEKIFDEYLK